MSHVGNGSLLLEQGNVCWILEHFSGQQMSGPEPCWESCSSRQSSQDSEWDKEPRELKVSSIEELVLAYQYLKSLWWHLWQWCPHDGCCWADNGTWCPYRNGILAKCNIFWLNSSFFIRFCSWTAYLHNLISLSLIISKAVYMPWLSRPGFACMKTICYMSW